MNILNTIEIKAFVPAKDYELSQEFYQDQSWRLRDFHIYDPSGVVWVIGQNI